MVTKEAEIQRASRACRLCRTRKKACDKKLPECGYCIQRGLTCVYGDDSHSTSAEKAAIFVGSVLAMRSSIPIWLAGDLSPSTMQSQSPGLYNSHQGVQDPAMSLAKAVHAQVDHIIRAANISSDYIQERYFRHFHPRLQILEPRLFQEAIEQECGVPAPDVTILLLAMYLITLEPPNDTIYITLRTIFTAVQTSIRTSIALIQASLLISCYEYTHGWLDAAYISVGACVRMGRLIGINRLQGSRDDESLKSDTRETLKLVESWNLWWGITILESALLSEVDENVQKSVSDYHLGDQSPLPLGSESTVGSSMLRCLKCVPLTVSKDNSDFTRLAQATCLLNRVRRAVTFKIDYSELAAIDKEIQSYLLLALNEDRDGCPKALHSISVAIAVRGLFVLHQRILNDVGERQDGYSRNSYAALYTASKMVLDAAKDHYSSSAKPRILFLPLCCRRNIQDAKAFLTDSGEQHCSAVDLQHLRLAEEALNKR
ncbi:hypothetical protein PV08_10863 [Exophiala spinifera]|uniref:Zn(2)-C6 fungal-type domain-containing protein n=1 Tax=Exophiala spinifera TaxID=91928 RepID=A0A0D1ZF31_9EURO|nr:uncharacterized protein PV08_10863 [Exophiala spinifera]KIW11562.1 hypothetical protein PV08_10863 [Exophiala spinifera]